MTRLGWSTVYVGPLPDGARAGARLNFPKPPGFDPHVLDRTVTYEHFSDRWPQHAKVSTPDWLLCLLARSGDFDGVVTLDRSQTQSTEAVALALTKINVVCGPMATKIRWCFGASSWHTCHRSADVC
jgi:hypothetical protein